MSVGKVLHGEDEFIVLLAKCNIDPDLILNDNVKSKLISYLSQKPIVKNEISKRVLVESKDDVEEDNRNQPRAMNEGNKNSLL